MDSHIEFKRKIDNARNILVGAVPSPAGQIDQITYALIYKFMSDIDDKSARLPGGTRQYFVDEYEKYDWHNLMRLDGQDKLNRYRDALSAMSKNEHLPEIFRSIYQNAFLPYNDPRTLNLFLKEVDGFVHTKSDAIGDAYEYLLSITGAQGDVGQFRTPRHIIKFIVDVVQPGKDDTVLDPACGTAGFLIAAYNYVRMQHDGVGEDGEQNGEQRLTADERKKLHGNYYGFDIDPTMVRTATVNMYLHGFSTPNIEIHDTLTSEEHWQNRYDVILANPPFMTPKGGIEPHGKFGVKANRAEVLFVDYIASHLKPNGRAGIIVPEGIIFQSGTAYKDLRKSLVNNSLYAVVSLPSGVFNPYAGVKTSILLLDKELAAKKDEILFVKIENDGYSLGAQRRKITGGQFPEALEVIEKFKAGEEFASDFAHTVSRSEIAESGDYNLSGDRYRVSEIQLNHDYPVVELVEVAEVRKGSAITKAQINPDGPIPVVAGGQKPAYSHDISNREPDVITISASGAYAGFVNFWTQPIFASDCSTVQSKDTTIVLNRYIYEILKYLQDDIYKLQTGGGQPHVYPKDIAKIKIPLPPIEIQREIVAELDGYQTIIDAAQTIVQTYKPTIKINPEWKVVELGDKSIFDIQSGGTPSSKEASYWDGDINWATLVDLPAEDFVTEVSETKRKITAEGLKKSSAKLLPEGTVLVSSRATLGRVGIARGSVSTNQGFKNIVIVDSSSVLSEYLAAIATTLKPKIESMASGGTFNEISKTSFETLKIPLPPIETQRKIVAELEAEQQLINANKKLIEIYQQKIKSKIAEVWGE